MSDVRLPPEVINHILDDPSIDTPSLKACALVSRRWLPFARQRLFHHFEIISTQENYGEFCEILQSSPGIADCVRDFEFTISPITFSNDWIVLVASICAKFTKVETFHFNRFLFMSFRDHANQKLIESFRPLMLSTTRLLVNGVRYENRDYFYRFINAFPNIIHLDLRNSGFSHEGLQHWEGTRHYFDSLSLVITPLRLHTLRLDECYGDMSQLFQPSISRLASLTVHIRMLGRPDHPITLSAFPSLENLEFFSFEQDSSAGKYELCGITRRMPKLKDFRAIMTIKEDHHAHDKVQWMDKVLSNLPSTIRTIHITVNAGVAGLDEMDWSPLDRILEGRKFDSLMSMTIEVKTYGMLPIIKWNLLEGLTSLKAYRQKRLTVL